MLCFCQTIIFLFNFLSPSFYPFFFSGGLPDIVSWFLTINKFLKETYLEVNYIKVKRALPPHCKGLEISYFFFKIKTVSLHNFSLMLPYVPLSYFLYNLLPFFVSPTISSIFSPFFISPYISFLVQKFLRYWESLKLFILVESCIEIIIL